MAFVHGYPRDLGWVKAHRRRPNRAESGQLPLIAPVPTGGAEAPPDAVEPERPDGDGGSVRSGSPRRERC